MMDPITAQKIEDFFSQYSSRHFPKGQMIIDAHEDPEHVFRLVEGRVKQYDISYRGDEVVLNTFKPPAFFPMSYAMNKIPNTYFFEAEEDVEAQLAPIPETIAFIRANSDVLYNLLSRVYIGTDGLLGRLAHLMASSAKSRLLYELLIEARRFGVRRGHGAMIGLSESELGSRAGLARETVSREMKQLKAEGLVSMIKNEIFVNDLERLAETVTREL